jgi:predicted transcriptional regulator
MPTMPANAVPLKQQAHALIDGLPETATWDDVVYEMAVRRSIERGLADADAGRLTDVKDVRREFGLSE